MNKDVRQARLRKERKRKKLETTDVASIDYDGEKPVYATSFRVEAEEGFDVIAGIESASREFIATNEEAFDLFEKQGGRWNLTDVDFYVPNELCEKFGFRKVDEADHLEAVDFFRNFAYKQDVEDLREAYKRTAEREAREGKKEFEVPTPIGTMIATAKYDEGTDSPHDYPAVEIKLGDGKDAPKIIVEYDKGCEEAFVKVFDQEDSISISLKDGAIYKKGKKGEK